MKNKFRYLFCILIIILCSIYVWAGCASKTANASPTGTQSTTNTVQYTKPLENHTHIWGAWVTDSEATCTSKGLQYRTCECGAIDKIEHAILQHNLGQWKVAKEATCNSEGLEVRSCSTCTLTETKIITKLTHVEGRWIITNNEKQILCANCEETVKTEQINISTGLQIENGVVISIDKCTDQDIIIPSNYNNTLVTAIGDGSFYQSYNITSLILPETVTTIERNAFYQCSNLKSIHFGSNITNICYRAFFKCFAIETLFLPKHLSSIEEGAFAYCTNLKSVYIESSLTTIGTGAFESCTSLTDIYFNGTIDKWNSIEKGDGWDAYSGNYIIHCVDGDISK